jgi:hypothetical protein
VSKLYTGTSTKAGPMVSSFPRGTCAALRQFDHACMNYNSLSSSKFSNTAQARSASSRTSREGNVISDGCGTPGRCSPTGTLPLVQNLLPQLYSVLAAQTPDTRGREQGCDKLGQSSTFIRLFSYQSQAFLAASLTLHNYNDIPGSTARLRSPPPRA